MPQIVDQIYGDNPVFFRLNAANKKIITGGTQIEVPLMYSRFTTGGSYSGFDVLPTVPQDTIKNGAWDWKQYAVLVVVDGLTLLKTDSPQSIANYITQYFAQAEMEMAQNLGTGIWSRGTNTKDIDGLEMAVDDAGVAPVYAGLTRSTNTWWNAQDDSTSAALTLPVLQSMFSNTQVGGRHPTLIASRKEQYNRYWNLNTSQQRFPVQAMGHDEQLASAGFTNLLFNNVPWVQDHNVFDGPNTSNSAIVFLNEDFINFAVSNRADFTLEDFQTPVNQDAMVAKMLWAGNLVVTNCAVQGKLSNISS